MMNTIVVMLFCLFAVLAWSAEYTATWDRYPLSPENPVVGFKLWRGANPYTLVAEFPGWARGSRWTQETPIASGEAFTLTAVFDGPVSTWVDAHCADPQYTDEQTCTTTNAGNTWIPAQCEDTYFTTEAECEGTESLRSSVYVYPMGDGTAGIRRARFKSSAGVAAAPLNKTTGARLR